MIYKIEKNTVQETLIIPLYARKVCSELYPNLYRDETAVRLIDEIDYDFSEAEKKSRSLMQRFGSLEVAMRQNDLAFEVRDYLKSHPNAAVVNLGCGLDSTGRSCESDGGEDDRQDMAQECEDQGCGCVFCCFGRKKRAFSVEQPFAGHKPRLYAGLGSHGDRYGGFQSVPTDSICVPFDTKLLSAL